LCLMTVHGRPPDAWDASHCCRCWRVRARRDITVFAAASTDLGLAIRAVLASCRTPTGYSSPRRRWPLCCYHRGEDCVFPCFIPHRAIGAWSGNRYHTSLVTNGVSLISNV